MNFVRKSLNSLVNLQQMFKIAEIELGMENTIGITLKTGVGVQSAILHVCQFFYHSPWPISFKNSKRTHIFNKTDALQNWHTITLGRFYFVYVC